ncbi:Uncharacterized protein Fot_11165 [Forsythia ovata]|uniref:Uncharacterized protein n=1 Tax=Forsythia ovata TaxID=205694 RepID=A0ABD1WMN5_9LAMI
MPHIGHTVVLSHGLEDVILLCLRKHWAGPFVVVATCHYTPVRPLVGRIAVISQRLEDVNLLCLRRIKNEALKAYALKLKGCVAIVVTSTEMLKERFLDKETDSEDVAQRYDEVNEKLLFAHPKKMEFKAIIEDKNGMISFLTNQVAKLRASLESYQVECSRLKSKHNEAGSRRASFYLRPNYECMIDYFWSLAIKEAKKLV